LKSIVSESYSQKKGEVLLHFTNASGQSQGIIQVTLSGDFSSLSFPDQFFRARRNTIDIFKELIGKRLEDIQLIENDRSFIMYFQSNISLLFKMHGNRSNLILYQDRKILSVYNIKLVKDLSLCPMSLEKKVDYSFSSFLEKGYKKTFPTLGKGVWSYAEDHRIDQMEPKEQYEWFLELLKGFETKEFYVTRIDGEVVLSLMKPGEVLEILNNPIEALNSFYQAHFRYNAIDKLRNSIQQTIQTRIRQAQQYYDKCTTSLQELETNTGPQQLADIIMANLYNIPAGSEEVELFDFYNNQNIMVKLSTKESPQKNAERLYKKGKSRPLEIANLKKHQESKFQFIKQGEYDLLVVEQSQSHKELIEVLKRYEKTTQQDIAGDYERFKHIEFMQYHIYIGRNAANNDLLTMKFAHKDDLWLHARDVSGAHVIIKNKAGQKTPKPVIEKAASLAAYYSERKNDSLCPVILTEKKYVRKIKGAPKGAVKVEKEKVLMVVPCE
jgi:predicted ribosome quality control (RQC) complex YloA/Tae2 family protein